MPLKLRAQYRGDRLNLLAKPQSSAVKHLFCDPFADQVDLQHRKVVSGHLLDKGLLGGIGHLGFGGIHRLSHIAKRFIQVLRYIKFDKETCHTLRGGRPQFYNAFEFAKFDFHGLNKQSFGVFRRNAIVVYPNVKKRQIHMGVVGDRQR